MTRVSTRTWELLAAAWSVVAVGTAAAGSVHGVVRDAGGTPPDDGLFAADVLLRDASGKVYGPIGTREKGEYELAGVPDGTYVLVASKTTYMPDDTLPVTVAGRTKADDVRLHKKDPTVAYLGKVAGNMIARAEADPGGRTAALASEWRRTRLLLPPSTQVKLGDELVKSAKWVPTAVPEIKRFADADAQLVLRGERVFMGTFSRGTAPDPKEVAALQGQPELLKGIFRYSFKNTPGTEKEKLLLFEDFQFKWKGTKAGDLFLESDSNELFRGKGFRLDLPK